MQRKINLPLHFALKFEIRMFKPCQNALSRAHDEFMEMLDKLALLSYPLAKASECLQSPGYNESGSRPHLHSPDSPLGGSCVLWCVQENPNAIPEGETPHAVTLFTWDDLVDGAKPGDRITVTGIFKASAMRISPRLRQLKARSPRLSQLPFSTISSNIGYHT